MKSIQRRVSNAVNSNPNWSSLVSFSHAVIGGNFNKQTIRKEFNKKVDKGDYAKEDKMPILKWLYSLSEK